MKKIFFTIIAIVVTAGMAYAAGDFIVDGNLGVGTLAAPTEKAEINGNLKVTGNLATNGTASITGQLNVGTQGIKFSDNSIQTKAAGPTTQNNVTGSRTFGTVYQNTTGKPMFVNATIRISEGSAAGNALALSDNNATPVTTVAVQSEFTNTEIRTLGFWVLSDNYYVVYLAPGSGTVYSWIEWY